jgi:glycine/D-amino acid oxidase-like deaminating enzyme
MKSPDPARLPPDDPRPGRRRVLRRATLAAAGTLAAGAGVNAIAPATLPPDRSFSPNPSYWARVLAPPGPALATDIAADVVVIGGGFTGLSSACYLGRALPGRRIVVLEAGACGNGASGRNGAMVLTLTEDRYLRQAEDAALERRLYELTADNIGVLQALCAELGMDCELEQRGALQVLDTDEQLRSARDFVERARTQGFPYELWDHERTAAAIGTRAYRGAVLDPRGGQVHPGKLVGLWKAAALRAGARIHENTPVAAIEEGEVHRIVTAGGQQVRAPVLVLATNAYTARLGYLRNAVAPVFDYVGITPVLSAAQRAAVGWQSGLPYNDSRTEVYYAGITRDGRIHLGGGPVDYRFNGDLREPACAAARHAALERELARLYPALAGVGFESAWSGAVDMSLDGSPAVGQMGRHRNIYYGIGYSGHGVNLSSVFGRIIADLATGQRGAWTWLPFLDRLPPYIPNEPLRWLGTQIGLAATRLIED